MLGKHKRIKADSHLEFKIYFTEKPANYSIYRLIWGCSFVGMKPNPPNDWVKTLGGIDHSRGWYIFTWILLKRTGISTWHKRHRHIIATLFFPFSVEGRQRCRMCQNQRIVLLSEIDGQRNRDGWKNAGSNRYVIVIPKETSFDGFFFLNTLLSPYQSFSNYLSCLPPNLS